MFSLPLGLRYVSAMVKIIMRLKGIHMNQSNVPLSDLTLCVCVCFCLLHPYDFCVCLNFVINFTKSKI